MMYIAFMVIAMIQMSTAVVQHIANRPDAEYFMLAAVFWAVVALVFKPNNARRTNA